MTTRRRWLRPVCVAAVIALGAGVVWAQRAPGPGRAVNVAGQAGHHDEVPVAPDTTLMPDVSLPGVTLPATTLPGISVPPSTLPGTGVPPVTPPPLRVPRPPTPPFTVAPLPAPAPAPQPPTTGRNIDGMGLYLVDADTGAVHPVLLHYTFENVSFSPDGRRLVFSGRSGDAPANGIIPTRLWTINADGSGLTQIAAAITYPENPSWSPDGRWIAYYGYPVDAKGDETLYLHDTTAGTERVLASVDQARYPMEWSPDSTRIAIASPNHGTIAVVDTVTGTKTEAPVPPLLAVNNFPNTVYEVSWSHDSGQLIASYLNGPAFVADTAGNFLRVLNSQARYARVSPTAPMVSEWIDFNAYVQPLDGRGARLLAVGWDPLDWSSDGRLIAAARGSGSIATIDAVYGQVHQLVQETRWAASAAGWAPVGHVFALIVEAGSGRRY